MKLRKIFSLLLAFLLVVSLAACGGGTTAQTEAPETDAAAGTEAAQTASEPVNIVWAGWSGEEEASKDIFQRMMDTYREQTGNEVTWVGWTWDDTAQQLLIRTQGGEQLDIAQMDIGIFNTIAAAGWDTVPTTIAEFEACMADIQAYDPEIVPYAVSTKDATCAGDFMPWLWTFGGAIFNDDGTVAINSEAAVECVQWYQGLMEKGYIAMDTGRGEARQLFAQGKVAFYDDAVVAKGQAVSNGVAPEDVVKVCSAMERPVLNAGDAPQSTMWGHMLVCFQDSEYKEQAAQLAQVLISNEVALDYFTNNGMPPVTKEAAALEEVTSDAYLSGFMNSTATARLEETARMTNANEIKTVITEELQYALLGQKTAEQAVADMAARLEAL